MRRALLVVLLLGFALGAGVRPMGLGDVTEIRVHEHADHTRVVVVLSRTASYETGFVDNPPRMYIDIADTWIENDVKTPAVPGRPRVLRGVWGGQNTLTTARVVVELDRRDRNYRTFAVRSPHPFRIVTDIAHSGATTATVAPMPGVGGVAGFDRRPVQRIVIDAGHGGKDPGAHGSGGLREKDVVLRIALALRERLKRSGLSVSMTREGDEFVSLDERTQFANRWHGDLFVSIHANASPRSRANGVETYLLDTRYDRNTARVAARENGTTVAALSELQRILASLRLSYSERYAAPLAANVHAQLLRSLRGEYGETRDLGVKRGPFVVLFQANMPAILVEVGFLTNRSEARRLRSRNFPKTVAAGIAKGILAYRDSHARSIVAGR